MLTVSLCSFERYNTLLRILETRILKIEEFPTVAQNSRGSVEQFTIGDISFIYWHAVNDIRLFFYKNQYKIEEDRCSSL